MKVKISIVVPFFNEELGIPLLVSKLRELEEKIGGRYDLDYVFIDDGSTDRTYELLNKDYGLRGKVRIFRHKKNKGLGAALRTAFKEAGGDIVVTLDSDCTFDPLETQDLVSLLEKENVDIAIGSHYHPQGKIENVPFYRLFPSKSLSIIYRIVLRSGIYTYSSIFRAYRRAVVKNVEFKSDDFLAVTEILVNSIRHGYTVAEHPTVLTVRKHGSSKIRIFHVMLNHIEFIISLLLHR